MEEELYQLRAQLAREQEGRAEERRRREEAEQRERQEQARREEEQRLRENAERFASAALPQNLASFLDGCHGLSRLLKPIDDPSCATTGDTTRQVGRLYPQEFIPWQEFPSQQRAVWERLPRDNSAWTSCVYPSKTNLDFLREKIEPIGSEDELRFLEKLLVEDMVRKLFEELGKNTDVDDGMRAGGTVSFENQARFRGEELASATRDIIANNDTARQPRNTRADQFCVLRSTDGIARPVVAIEYKSPHKLTLREIYTGLRGERIRPDFDIIGRSDDDFEFLCKYLLTAVLVQLFSYMIDKGVRFGYVSTGEAYIFLSIPADPTSVLYSVNIPCYDHRATDDRLERTSVSQIFAFIHQALQAEPPDQAWQWAARNELKRWKIEYVDVLKMIPETERRSRDHSAYRPGRWAPDPRTSPVVLRKRCGSGAVALQDGHSKSDDDDENRGKDSPSTRRETRAQTAKRRAQGRLRGGERSNQTGEPTGGGGAGATTSNSTIESRAYCTHQCLRGLQQGLPLDSTCPNFAAHGRSHISPQAFLRLIRRQLAVDRGKYADCCALYIHGSRGALLKLRLTSHGYTMVAKAVATSTMRHLQNEKRVYDELESLQGRYIPVCCGVVGLDLPYMYDGVELTQLLLLSWAGRSLANLRLIKPNSLPSMEELTRQCRAILKAIHDRAVLHCDVEPRNIMFNPESQSLMLIDFERSELYQRRALGELSLNRKWTFVGDERESKKKVSRFTREMSVAEMSVWKACSSRAVHMS